jgi:hypothetical protein
VGAVIWRVLLLLLWHAQAAPTAAVPARPGWQTASGPCEWRWREAGGIGLWAEICNLPTGRWEVAWDAALRAFVEQRNGQTQRIVVQPMAIPETGGLALIRARLVAAALPANRDNCVWRRLKRWQSSAPVRHFTLVDQPPAARAPTAQGEVPEPACGPYAAGTHGVRYLRLDRRWPALLLFIDEGQERPLFDPASITVRR